LHVILENAIECPDLPTGGTSQRNGRIPWYRLSSSDYHVSNPDPLDFGHTDVIVAPVVKPGGFRVRVSGHALRDFDTPAVREVVRNPRGPEGVAAYRGFNPGTSSTAAHHVPDIRARHRPGPKLLFLAERGPEQRPLAVISDTRRLDVGIKIFFQLVVAGHLIDFDTETTRQGRWAAHQKARRVASEWSHRQNIPIRISPLANKEDGQGRGCLARHFKLLPE